MTILKAIISGIVQGLTEFLPVSSSGHLVFLHKFFGFKEPEIFFDVCLHAGTLIAVILYFGRDILKLIREKDIKWFWYVFVGTVPAVIAAVLWDKQITAFFADPARAALMLLFTALILFIGHLSIVRRKQERRSPTILSSLAVGVSQAFALLPGISRSGMTISTALVCGIKREDAYKLSFFLSIPAVLGAVVYKGLMSDIAVTGSYPPVVYAAGIVSAFMTGILSLHLLWWVIRKDRLLIFAAYCFLIGGYGVLFF